MQLLFPIRFLAVLAWVVSATAVVHAGAPDAGTEPPPRAAPVPIAEFAARYPLDMQGGNAEAIELMRGAFRISVRPDSRHAVVQNVMVWLQNPVQYRQGQWVLAQVDADRVLDPLLRAYRHVPPDPVRTIVLDPGHGGADSGAVGADGWTEKEVVLDVALRARARLEAEGFRVYLTRDDDRFLSLSDRIRVAEERHADVFVSIHVNGWRNPDAEGIETYVLAKAGYPATNSRAEICEIRLAPKTGNRHDGANMVLGYSMQRRLLEQTGSVDRGLRHARFQVLRHAPCPAALVECGFITHPEESARLRDEAYRERIAKGIAEGLLDYAREADRARWVYW